MGEMVMKKNIVFAMLLVACMQLEYVEITNGAGGISSGSGGEQSSSSGFINLQIGRQELEHRGISYYEAILICNKMSLEEGLDTLYQYDKPVFTEDSLFWLPNLKVLENRSGYRLPTREEWILAEENGEIEKLDKNLGEWLYGEAYSQYSVFELAPDFLKAVGLYREREGYPVYGMRVAKVFFYIPLHGNSQH
jgi:hypothetical protein